MIFKRCHKGLALKGVNLDRNRPECPYWEVKVISRENNPNIRRRIDSISKKHAKTNRWEGGAPPGFRTSSRSKKAGVGKWGNKAIYRKKVVATFQVIECEFPPP